MSIDSKIEKIFKTADGECTSPLLERPKTLLQILKLSLIVYHQDRIKSTGTIPDIPGLKDAINKKWNINSGPNDNNIPQMYVHDVENNVPNKIVSQENKNVNISDETKYLLKSLSDDAVEIYRKVSESEGQNGVDSGTVLRNFNRFYLGGLRGESFLKLSARYGDRIFYQSKKLAYEQGIAEAKQNEKKRVADSKKAKVHEGGLENRETLQGVEGIDKKQLDLIDRVSKVLGVKLRISDIVKNSKGKEVNAKVSDGVIEISKKAVMGEDSKGGALRFLFNHEITHRIGELAPKQYRKFCDIALDYASLKTGLSVNELIDRYSNERGSNGEDLNVFELMDEIASDVAGMDIFSSDLIEYAARENIGVFEKMKNLLFDVLDKLGIAKYSEVDKLKRTWQKAFDKAKKQAESNSRNVNLQEDSGVERHSIERIKGTNLLYVKADRQVIKGETPEEWGASVENYINDTIRQGKDVKLVASDGDVLTITADTAGKAKFRNYITHPDGTSTMINDAEYLTKLNAESHIDELSMVSKRGKKDVPDYKNHDFAKDGFNYRTAYFEDFDGQYYKLTLSVGKNGEINTVYNVGKIEEASFPLVAQRPSAKKHRGNKASKRIVTDTKPIVKNKSQNSSGKINPFEYDYSKSFAEQIDDYKAKRFPKNDTLIVGKTEDVYIDIGFNALPVTIAQGHIKTALDANSDADHYLGETKLKQLPNVIGKPIAIIRSKTNSDRVVALLPFKQNGKTVITPFEIDGQGINNKRRIDSNAITTVFGKGNILQQLSDALNSEANGNIEMFYWNKKEALSLLQSKGLQLPSSLPQDGFIHSIHEKGANINTKFKNVTETQQFKRWFGKSKVVNDDGTPKVVYHGTGTEFWIFDKSKLGRNTGASSSKKAIFFTDSENVAKGYAEDARPKEKNNINILLILNQ